MLNKFKLLYYCLDTIRNRCRYDIPLNMCSCDINTIGNKYDCFNYEIA